MKKVVCFLMAFVVVCCSFAQAAVVSSGSQNSLIEMTISQQQDPSYRLLSASQRLLPPLTAEKR